MASALINDLKLLESLIKPQKVYNRRFFKPIKAFSIDSRSIKKGEAFIAIKGKISDGHKFIGQVANKGANCIIGQKYIATDCQLPFLVVKDTKQALIAICRYIRESKKPFVYAITGSVGKTTTKEMLYFLIEDHWSVIKSQKTENNLLGVAKTILALRDEQVLIAELGTNHKGEISTLSKMLVPDVGIITSIKPVHLEGLGSLGNIFKEKLSLLSGNPKMKLILNHDDAYLKKVKAKGAIYWFGSSKSNNLFARCLKRDSLSSQFLIQNRYRLRLPRYQESFIVNILAAILAARLRGLKLEILVSRIKKFKTLPAMRMQVKKLKRLLVLNDAYNSNPYSVIQGLKSLKDHPLKKIAVIGDMLELGKKSLYYHQSLAPQVIKSKFDYCLTFGNYSRHLQKKLLKLGYRRAFHFSSHRDLASFINKNINKNHRLKQSYLVFLKGSRKMELEKVISHLK